MPINLSQENYQTVLDIVIQLNNDIEKILPIVVNKEFGKVGFANQILVKSSIVGTASSEIPCIVNRASRLKCLTKAELKKLILNLLEKVDSYSTIPANTNILSPNSLDLMSYSSFPQ